MLEKDVKYNVKKSVAKSQVKPEEKTIDLQIKDVEAKGGVGKQIPMHELLKAQRQIDQNNAKAGIVKEPISRPRSKQTLPLANK